MPTMMVVAVINPFVLTILYITWELDISAYDSLGSWSFEFLEKDGAKDIF